MVDLACSSVVKGFIADDLACIVGKGLARWPMVVRRGQAQVDLVLPGAGKGSAGRNPA